MWYFRKIHIFYLVKDGSRVGRVLFGYVIGKSHKPLNIYWQGSLRIFKNGNYLEKIFEGIDSRFCVRVFVPGGELFGA